MSSAEPQLFTTRPRVPGLSLASGLWLVVALGLGARLYFFARQAGMHYPDEIFQYVEPTSMRMRGCAILPWEFVRGARNWLLPAYYGALLEVGRWLGLTGSAAIKFLWLNNLVQSLVLIPAGYLLGRAAARHDGRAGLVAAAAMALFPLFGYFSTHTFADLHSCLFVTLAYALWYDGLVRVPASRRRRSLAVGLLLGAAFAVRYSALIFFPVLCLDYVWRRRWRELLWCAGGIGALVALVAVVDWVTWGRPLHSLIEYFDYNVLEGRSREHGVLPWHYYLTTLASERFGWTRLLLVGPALLLCWRHRRLLLAWLVPLAILSFIGHKEERFLLGLYPFVLVSSLNGAFYLTTVVARALATPGMASRRYLPTAVSCAMLLGICAWAWPGVHKLDFRFNAGVFASFDWLRRQQEVTGVLSNTVFGSPGYTVLEHNVPLHHLDDKRWLDNPLFSHVVATRPGDIRYMSRRRDFEEVGRFEEARVFRRTRGPQRPPLAADSALTATLTPVSPAPGPSAK